MIGNRLRTNSFFRFCVVGSLSAAMHYGIYYLLLMLDVNVNLSYVTGYILSFIANFFATTYFTFQSSPSWTRFVGFAGSHGVNFVLHIVLLNILLWAGVNKLIVPVLVMLIAMLIQFSILRFIFKGKE